MEPGTVALISIVGLAVLLAIGMHIGFAMALAGLVGTMMLLSPEAALSLFGLTVFETALSFELIIIPLFVLMGQFATAGGLSQDLYKAFNVWLGNLPGGLGLATLSTLYLTPVAYLLLARFTAPKVEEERRLVREAQEEIKEEVVVVEAKAEWTETHITKPAEPAREEVTERRLVSAAVEAKDAVYETVTVPAIDRPADNDTVRLGLIAQDVQSAMTEAGVEFDLVNESPNGKLSLKYGNLVMPLIKAVQELSARVKTLEG